MRDHLKVRNIVGHYVKQGAVVSTFYATVSMLRTIEDVLGIEPLGLNDGLAVPMSDAFDRQRADLAGTDNLPAHGPRRHGSAREPQRIAGPIS